MVQILHICQIFRTFARFIETFETLELLNSGIAALMYGKLHRISS